jgi:MFS family permease
MGSERTPIPRAAWLALGAAGAGWMLDAFDVMLYAFALTFIRDEFALSSAAAGALASATLVFSAVGGIAFGLLADRIGRVRALVLSILAYSIGTGLTAASHTVLELVLCRAIVGIGLGGEWSAGSVLVAESWPGAFRGRAIGFMQAGWAIGYAMAALVAAAVIPTHGWRILFAIGIVPALLTLAIRRAVPEPAIARRAEGPRDLGSLLRPPLLARVVVATSFATALLFAYWGLFTWMPTYLASPVERGGVGLGLVKSTSWILAVQAGAFAGYTTFGFLADRIGRRPAVRVFVLGAAVIVPVFALASHHPTLLLVLAPAVGYFGHGAFSVFGSLLAELFPTAIRGTAQGFCYNAGRALSALAPVTLGAIADARGLGAALALTVAFFLAAAILVGYLPETKGTALT